MVMAALYAGYKLPSGKYEREPDNFADFIVTDPRVDAYYKKVMPAMWKEWNEGKKDAYDEYMKQVVRPMRAELTEAGFAELTTADAVHEFMAQTKGTSLVVINSVCGCAAGDQRQGIGHPLRAVRKGVPHPLPCGRRAL